MQAGERVCNRDMLEMECRPASACEAVGMRKAVREERSQSASTETLQRFQSAS